MLDPATIEAPTLGDIKADQVSEANALTASHQREHQLNALIGDLEARIFDRSVKCERFQTVFLDENKRVLSVAEFGEGQISALQLSLRDLFHRALCAGARGMIMAHNHPSGDCRPSARDFDATIKVSKVAKYLEIEIIDHLIFTENSVYSMRMGGVLRS